jgi:hypothetical protein
MQSLHKNENLLFEDFHGFLGKTGTFPRMESPTEINDSLGASYGRLPETPSHDFLQKVFC